MSEKPVRLRLMFFVCALVAAAVCVLVCGGRGGVAASEQFETRCGWFSNPTPANIWLYDKDGEWTIGVQGGYQVEGDWPWPEFKRGQWVKTNGEHGYGCVCMQTRVNKETHEVLEIKSARPRPLSACKRDRALNRWKDRLD